LASFWIAGYKIELIEPARDDGAVARFLAERGEGFHHLAVHVDRLDPLVERLRDEGLRVIGEATIGGGRKTAFLHPKDGPGRLPPPEGRPRTPAPVLDGPGSRRSRDALMRPGAVPPDAAGTLFEPVEPVGVTYARVACRHGITIAADAAERGFRDAFTAAPPL